MTNFSPFYREYIRSEAWFRKRDKILKRAGNKCEKCGSTESLNCHHITYKRLGHEWDKDLIILCKRCHAGVHRRKKVKKFIQKIIKSFIRSLQ